MWSALSPRERKSHKRGVEKFQQMGAPAFWWAFILVGTPTFGGALFESKYAKYKFLNKFTVKNGRWKYWN